MATCALCVICQMPDVVNLSHAEVDSECSGADSGKGTSEEGETNNWQQTPGQSSPNDQPSSAPRPANSEYRRFSFKSEFPVKGNLFDKNCVCF